MGTQSIQPMSFMTANSNPFSKNQPQSPNEPQPLKQAASGGWKNLNAALWKKIAAAGAILVVLGTIAALNRSPIPSISSNGPLKDDLQNSLANRVCPLNATREPEICMLPLTPLTVTPTNENVITQFQEDIKGLKHTISEQKILIEMLYSDIKTLFSNDGILEKQISNLSNYTETNDKRLAESVNDLSNNTIALANFTSNLITWLDKETCISREIGKLNGEMFKFTTSFMVCTLVALAALGFNSACCKRRG